MIQGTQPREVRSGVLTLMGLLLIAASTLMYSLDRAAVVVPTPQQVALLTGVAQVYLLALLAGVSMVVFGLRNVVTRRIHESRVEGFVPLKPSWILPHVLTIGRYRRAFVASTLIYGVFYAVLTSMIVVQPGVDFPSAYGVAIPSAEVIPVVGPPLFTPVLTVYLANHLGLFLVPLTVLLLVAIAPLVGVNMALTVFAFDNRVRGGGSGWFGGLGAAVGLFTGCPTCAGIFFANFLGGSGAVSFATALAYYQPVFILISLPVLVATPYLISRSLSRTFKDGCVYLRTSRPRGRTP